MNNAKGIVAEGGFAETVLVDGNKISVTVAFAESYLRISVELCEIAGR